MEGFADGGKMRYLFGLLLWLSYSQYGISCGLKNNLTFFEDDSTHRDYIYISYSEYPSEELEYQYYSTAQEDANRYTRELEGSFFEEPIDESTLSTPFTEPPTTYSLHLILLDEQSGVVKDIDTESDIPCHHSIQESYLAVAGIGKSDIDSYPYEIGSVDLENGGIGFINGINNLEEEAKEHALRISKYAQGIKILGVYNATHSFLLDILECILGQCRLPTPPSRMLKNHWNHFISTRGPEAKFLQICHSSGTIYVYNALSSSPKEVRERIIVLAISPGAVIPKKLCYEAYNYASKRDFIPHLDALGKIRYGDQLILLDPHPDAAHFDHAFDSPTFQDIILFHITNYLKQIGCLK